LKRPVVVGHSQSASIAYRFAKRDPSRVSALVLLSPVGHDGVKLLPLYKFLTPKFGRRLLPSLSTRLAIRLTLHRVYGRLRRFSERDIDEYYAPCQFAEFPIAQRDSLHAFDWHQPVVGRLDIPTLLMHGSKDHLVRGGSIRDYERAIPGIQVAEIPDAGHIIPEEADGVVNETLIPFLRGLARS
jgi:pimeloyl-ACP methyl ester carboxylesterase